MPRSVTSSSSIRVNSQTRKRVSELVSRLHASSQQEVIDRALDRLEQDLYWTGFEEEAKAYLKAYPQEHDERRQFAGVSGDGMSRKR